MGFHPAVVEVRVQGGGRVREAPLNVVALRRPAGTERRVLEGDARSGGSGEQLEELTAASLVGLRLFVSLHCRYDQLEEVND